MLQHKQDKQFSPANGEAVITVVIPAYRAANTISSVLQQIPGFVDHIIVVDDCSPDNLGEVVSALCEKDSRIILLRNETNGGVGKAVMNGYRKAIELNSNVVVKLDSDGQMDPGQIMRLISPILAQQADYTKGNRFINERELKAMPLVRRLGNWGLSFLTKVASGYWNIFDPTNGFTAIGLAALTRIDLKQIDPRYFFETSLLIELGIQRAVVKDVAIPAIYGEEKSSLSEFHSLVHFPRKLMQGFCRRISKEYFLLDFTAVSIFLVFGIFLGLFGLIWGVAQWIHSTQTGIPATTGTVMIAVVPIMMSIELLLQAFVMDIQNVPDTPLSGADF